MHNKELANALKEWAKQAKWDDRNLLTRDEVAKALKAILSQKGYWKNKKRGVPKRIIPCRSKDLRV